MGKGEMARVRDHRTAGDGRGTANPTWSKTKRTPRASAEAIEGGPPELPGRSHAGRVSVRGRPPETVVADG